MTSPAPLADVALLVPMDRSGGREEEDRSDGRAIPTGRHKLLVVDGHALVRRGFALSMQLARPDATVLEAASAADAATLAGRNGDLGLILLDVDGEDGPLTLAGLAQAVPTVPIVAVSASEDPAHMVACVAAGARGYLLKSSPSDVLKHIVSLVLADSDYVPLPRIAIVQGAGGRGSEASAARQIARQLTERQRDVFRLLQQGQSNKEIARDLGVLEGTVKVHVRAIMQKLGVKNRTQVAVMAVRGQTLPE